MKIVGDRVCNYSQILIVSTAFDIRIKEVLSIICLWNCMFTVG